MASAGQAQQWLTIKDVAAALSVSTQTVRRMIAAGSLRGARRINQDSAKSRWRIPEGAVASYQEQASA